VACDSRQNLKDSFTTHEYHGNNLLCDTKCVEALPLETTDTVECLLHVSNQWSIVPGSMLELELPNQNKVRQM